MVLTALACRPDTPAELPPSWDLQSVAAECRTPIAGSLPIPIDTGAIDGALRRLVSLSDSSVVLAETAVGVYRLDLSTPARARPQLLAQWGQEVGTIGRLSSAILMPDGDIEMVDDQLRRLTRVSSTGQYRSHALLRPTALTDSVVLARDGPVFVESGVATRQYEPTIGSLRRASPRGAAGERFLTYPVVARRAKRVESLVGIGRYLEFQPMLSRTAGGGWVVAVSDSIDIRVVAAPSAQPVRVVGAVRRAEFPVAERDSVVASALKSFGRHAPEYRAYVEQSLVGVRDSLQAVSRVRAVGRRVLVELHRACRDRSLWLALNSATRSTQIVALPAGADVLESPVERVRFWWRQDGQMHVAELN